MTEYNCKIFATKRGAQIKLLFSTLFFYVTVYLADTQNFRVICPASQLANISANIGHIWFKKNWHTLLGVVYCVKKDFNNFRWKLKSFWRKLFYSLESDMKTYSALEVKMSCRKVFTTWDPKLSYFKVFTPLELKLSHLMIFTLLEPILSCFTWSVAEGAKIVLLYDI